MSKNDKCSICGRRWTDPDCPHGVEGLERVGGVGWVPDGFGSQGMLSAVDLQKIAAVGLQKAREQLAVDDFGSPGRSRDGSTS